MRSERITFKNRQGIDLAARFDRPDDEPAAYALAAHCFTCTKDIPAMHRISVALVERKIGVLRFDFTGLGHSGGEFANSGFKANLDDIRAAVAYLKEREAAPQIFWPQPRRHRHAGYGSGSGNRRADRHARLTISTDACQSFLC